MNHRSKRLLIKIVCILALVSSIASGSTCRLIRATPAETPSVVGHLLSYQLEFEFSSVPTNRWAYFERKKNTLVIEFLDATISSSLSTLKGNGVFRDIRVENLASNRALSGKISQIRINFMEVWQYMLVSPDKTHLVLTINKDLQPLPGAMESSQH